MGRPSKWSGKTTAIRVPEHLADQLMELAQQLDQGFVQNEKPAIETFDGPYLVSVNEKRYLVDPPKALIGAEAEALREATALLDGLSHKELMLLLARLTEEWCEPLPLRN